MPSYLVVEQEARVVERTYRVDAPDKDEAIYLVEEMDPDEREDALESSETMRTHLEIISADES